MPDRSVDRLVSVVMDQEPTATRRLGEPRARDGKRSLSWHRAVRDLNEPWAKPGKDRASPELPRCRSEQMRDAGYECIVGKVQEVLGGEARRARCLPFCSEGQDGDGVPVAPRERAGEPTSGGDVHGSFVMSSDRREVPGQHRLAHRDSMTAVTTGITGCHHVPTPAVAPSATVAKARVRVIW